MLTRNVTERVDLPHEPGQFVVVRHLNWLQIEEAKRARTRAVLERAREVQDLIGVVQAASPEVVAQATDAAAADVLSGYDAATLLREGVTGWSYPEPVTPENVADLDEVTKDLVARAVVLLFSRRSEEESKNGSAPSTGSSTVSGARSRRASG